jgi:regulator of sigma E protease
LKPCWLWTKLRATPPRASAPQKRLEAPAAQIETGAGVMTDLIRSILAFIVVLGPLVFFHELGHFLAARARGVVVEAFCIGFGPALLSWKAKSGTVWKLSALPLGGYVKMQGWGEEENQAAPIPGSFGGASLASKAMIVAAGPVANLLLAFVLFIGLFAWVGQMQVLPVLSRITPGSPAAAGGLLAGDRIVTAEGKPIKYFQDLQRIIESNPDTALDLTVNRGGNVLQEQVRTGRKDAGGAEIGFLGVEGDQETMQHYSLPMAVGAAGMETWNVTTATLAGLWNLAVHHTGVQDLGGPIRIAQLSGKVASLGAASLISFIAMLSINLGLVNLVPIPILDGGHLLFYAGEAVYGKPVPRKAQEIGLRLGFALLLTLFAFTTFNDLTQMGAIHWVTHLLG